MMKISRVMKILRVTDGNGRIITQLGVCDRYVRSEVGAHIKWVWQIIFLPDGCKLGSKSLNPILRDLIGRIGQ